MGNYLLGDIVAVVSANLISSATCKRNNNRTFADRPITDAARVLYANHIEGTRIRVERERERERESRREMPFAATVIAAIAIINFHNDCKGA